MSILRTLSLAALLAVLVTTTPSTGPQPAVSAPMTTPSSVSIARDDAGSDVAEDARYAKTALDVLASKYRYLDGVSVTVGTTPDDKQAVAFYTEGHIVISRAHTVSIDAILAHEIWHVIDWRDNGRLDWGEQLPPSNPDTYLKR